MTTETTVAKTNQVVLYTVTSTTLTSWAVDSTTSGDKPSESKASQQKAQDTWKWPDLSSLVPTLAGSVSDIHRVTGEPDTIWDPKDPTLKKKFNLQKKVLDRRSRMAYAKETFFQKSSSFFLEPKA